MIMNITFENSRTSRTFKNIDSEVGGEILKYAKKIIKEDRQKLNERK